MLFLGDDWAEAHHDVEPQDEHGRVLARRRLPEGVTGLAQLHALIGDHLDDHAQPESVLVGIETDRGGWVQALVATGYVVYAMNRCRSRAYRERHTTSGAKSDPGDAHVLAEIVRVDRGHHRPVAGDSELAEVVKTLARTHQMMIWIGNGRPTSCGRCCGSSTPPHWRRSAMTWPDVTRSRCWPSRPYPATGRSLTRTRVVSVLRKAGRQRNLQSRAEAILTALHTEQLGLPEAITEAYGVSVSSMVAVLSTVVAQAATVEVEVGRCFGEHPGC